MHILLLIINNISATEGNKNTDDLKNSDPTSQTTTDKKESEDSTKEPNVASSFTPIFLLVISAIITVINYHTNFRNNV